MMGNQIKKKVQEECQLFLGAMGQIKYSPGERLFKAKDTIQEGFDNKFGNLNCSPIKIL